MMSAFRVRGAIRSWILRSFLVVAALALTGLLAACGSSNNDSSTGTASGPATKPASGAPSWCGSKPITLGIQDGGGANGWSKESLNQVKLEAAKCPSVKKTIVVNAGFDVQKAISGLNGLVAQGANAVVIIPDAGGPAELPGIRQAAARGVKVVPWGANPTGSPGKDYATYVDWDPEAAGGLSAEWLVKQLGGKGNIVHLGGPAGNAVDAGELKGAAAVFAKNPGVKLLTDTKNWPVTNWDPAQSRKVMAGLLTKYPKIDGLLMSDGQAAAAVVKVFEDAGRKVPAIATLEANQLGCLWKANKGGKNAFPLATISARNWLGRVAVRKAVAAVNGLPQTDKSIVALPLYEDSTAGADLAPKCDPNRPPDAFLSNSEPDSVLDALVAG
ncbi:MAG: ribose transport system substrate-binding protein [Thermoleophilaceae bacterium]|jgi:ribose transport system substrate-binding protein|nr:ribose transport system substrate-binding protein [Thermoleophilaceae bacterium]